MSQEMLEIGPRKMAQTMLEGGCISIIAAFNMTDDPARPWRFPKEAHAEAARLLQELGALFEAGGFEEHRGPVVEADETFQRFMDRALTRRDGPKVYWRAYPKNPRRVQAAKDAWARRRQSKRLDDA